MKRVTISICMIALFYSCTTNDSEIQQPESNFYALTVGNSWIYKNYRFNNQTENYDNTGVVDSISIVGIEEVNADTYFKFRTWTTGNDPQITFCNPNGEHFELLRDSLGYLIRDDGSIKYANNDFNERILQNQSFGVIYEKLQENPQSIMVEAGTFECLDTERYLRDADNQPTPGLDHFYYSEGVGLIYDTSSFISTSYPHIIRRLDSYNVQ